MQSVVDGVALSLTCYLIESTGTHPKFAAKQAAELAAKDGYVVDAKELEAKLVAELRRRKRLGLGGVTHWAIQGRGLMSKDPACGAQKAEGACSTRQRDIVSCRRCRACIVKWERKRKKGKADGPGHRT